MALKVGELFATLDLKDNNFKKGLGNAASVARGVFTAGLWDKALGGMMKAATTAFNGLQKTIDSFADYEQLVGGVETLFGAGGKSVEEYAASVGKSVSQVQSEYNGLMSAQSAVFKNANAAFKTAGISANQYMETVTSFSASMVASLGGDTQKAAQMSDMAIQDMSDNANKMGSDFSAIQQAYQGFAKQNYTMLDNLKLGYGGNKTEMERLLADATKLSGIEYNIDSFSDIVSAIHVVQDEMGITGTTMKEAEGTITGSINMLKASFQNLVVGFADANADLDTLVDDVYNSLTSVVGNIMPVVMRVFERIPDAFSAAGELIAANIGPAFEYAFTSLLPAAEKAVSGIAQAIAPALDTIGGVIESSVPKLLPKLTNALNALIKSVSKILPGLFKGIAAQIPDILSSIGEVVPILVESLLESFGAALGEIIQRLPEILASLVPAIFKTLGALLKGQVGMLKSIIVGIFPEAKQLLMSESERLWDSVEVDNSTREIARTVKADVSLNTEVTTDNYKEKIDTAVENIQTAVDGIPDLTPHAKNNLLAALLTKSASGVLGAAMESYGVTATKADEAAKTIETEWGKIDSAIDDCGLDETQTAELNSLIESNPTKKQVEDYLVSCGVDEGVASTAAETITGSSKTINDAIDDLGLDPSTTGELKRSAIKGRWDMYSAIQTLKLPEGAADDVVKSMETLSGTLTSGAADIFGGLIAAFTNGEAGDDNSAAATAKAALDSWAEQAKQAINDWYQKRIDEIWADPEIIDKEGAIADATEQMKSAADKVENVVSSGGTWATELANASTSEVAARVDELWALLDQIIELDAVLGSVENKITSYGETNRKAVESGYEGDQTRQLEAMQTTSLEYQSAVQSAETARQNALEEAATLYGDNMEAYTKRVAEIDQEYEQANQEAADNYNAHMNAIYAGMVANAAKNNPDLAFDIDMQDVTQKLGSALDTMKMLFLDPSLLSDTEALNDLFDTFDLGQGMRDAIMNSLNNSEPIDMQTIIDALGLTPEQLANIEEVYGMSLEEVSLGDVLGTGVDFTGASEGWTTEIEKELEKTDIPETIKAAMEKDEGGNSIVLPVSEIDCTNFESALQTGIDGAAEAGTATYKGIVEKNTNLSSSGVSSGLSFGSGFVNGMAQKLQPVIDKAKELAKAAVNAVNETIEKGSPSKVMIESGNFFGEGFAIGIRDKIMEVKHASEDMANSAIQMAQVSGTFGGSGRLAIASASGNSIIDYDKLADAVNARPQTFNLNGRTVAEANVENTATAQNARSRDIALRYGA